MPKEIRRIQEPAMAADQLRLPMNIELAEATWKLSAMSG